MRTNDRRLTNLYGSVVFHIQHRLVLFSGPSKPQVGSREIPREGAQSEIYMHSYSKYIMPIGNFLREFSKSGMVTQIK